MSQSHLCRWLAVPAGILATILIAPSQTTRAQTVAGQAKAVQSTVFTLLGASVTALADTGSLDGPTDARQASQGTGRISSLFRGETLHATTIGWPDQVASEASVAGIALNVAGTAIGADFVMSRARAAEGLPASGRTTIEGLSINGLAIPVTSEPNQTIAIPGGQLVINEQRVSAAGATVNALHLVVHGLADVVVASATANLR